MITHFTFSTKFKINFVHERTFKTLMISIVTCKASHASYFSYFFHISTITPTTSTMVVCIIFIVIHWLLILVDYWSLVHYVAVWFTFHVEHLVLWIVCVLFTNFTPTRCYILKIHWEIVYIMRGNFLTYFPVILCLYYSNILSFILIVPTSILRVPFYNIDGAP